MNWQKLKKMEKNKSIDPRKIISEGIVKLNQEKPKVDIDKSMVLKPPAAKPEKE